MLHIGRNIFSLVVSRITAGVILFLIYTRLVQYLGPEVAGQYGLISSYLLVFSFFIDLGMSQLVIKKVSENQTHADKYLNNYFLIQLVLGFVFMAIMDAVVYFANYPPTVQSALYVASLGLLLSAVSLPFRSVVNAFQKLTVIAKVNFVNSLINGAMMALAIWLRQDIFFLAFISVTVSIFDIIVYGYIVHKKFVPFRWQFDPQFIKTLFIWTWPFTLLTVFSIYNRVDTLLLPHFRNFTETGYYAAAYKFWDVLAFLPNVIGISLYPFFAEMIAKGLKDQVKIGLETYTRYMIALGLPLALGAYLLAPQLTLAFYGKDFLPAAGALWLLVSAVAILLIYSPANSLIISQETRLATRVTGSTLFLNLILNVIFIPKYGFVAAAAVTVLSELNQAFWYWILIRKKIIEYRFLRYFIKPIVAGAVMAAAVMFLKETNLWLAILGGAVVYGLVLLGQKFFQRSDWELFKAAIDIRKPAAAPASDINPSGT
ncbi:MAG: flippase [Candidatus Doudnabacteria bacterium]|nr:flippase [Candidatus Doudnabacteria bacterium]